MNINGEDGACSSVFKEIPSKTLEPIPVGFCVSLYKRREQAKAGYLRCAFYCRCMRRSSLAVHEIASALRPAPGAAVSFPTDDLVMGAEPEAGEQIRTTVCNNLT